jgi:hypothetical protein
MVFSMCLAPAYYQMCYDLYGLWDLTNVYIYILLSVLNIMYLTPEDSQYDWNV